MRFNYDRSVDTQPLSAAATDLQQKVSTPVNGALELLHVFNPHLVNEAKAGFNRSTSTDECCAFAARSRRKIRLR